jgi:NADH-quinone oxidoreductase subunit H
MIPFALVLIGTALPAESLGIGDIVASQQGLWNVVRTPLGLPVYLVTALGMAFWGPLATPTGADLAGGLDLEASGVQLLAWRIAQYGILVGMSAVGASVFLAGWAGPVLPGPLWVVLKTALLLAVLVACRHVVARVRVERYVVIAWVVLLPLALLDVFLTGWWLLLAAPGSSTSRSRCSACPRCSPATWCFAPTRWSGPRSGCSPRSSTSDSSCCC